MTTSLSTVRRPSRRVLDVVTTLVRLGLTAVWLISGGLKLSDPGQTYLAVQGYEILPAWAEEPVATALPLLEIALGLFLLVGLGTRLVALVSTLVFAALIAAVAQAWARGLTIDCGCFGGGGQVDADQTRYPQEIARDVGFIALCGWLLVRPRTVFSVDGWLGRAEPAAAAATTDASATDDSEREEGI